MSESSQLIYPTINLFLYDLREGLGKANEIATNRQKFRDKISPDVDPQLKDLASKENLEADNVRLAEKNFSDQDGYYLARQIGDSYTLQINCSGESAKETPDSPNQPKTPQSIQKLADIKKSIVDHINHHNKSKEIEPNKQGTIGQTWLVWGQLLNGQDGEQVARQCYQQLNPDSKSKPDFKEHGKWLEDAQVFEYWHLPNNWLQVQKPEASKEVQDLSQKWQSFSQENYHLIILLFPADKSFDRITSILKQNYVNFTYLFLYRHKILWAYWQSRQKKAELKEEYAKIQDLIEKSKERFQDIRPTRANLEALELILIEALQISSQYAIDLNFLNAQGKTIKVNVENYKKRWQYIAPTDSGSNLQILEKFSNLATEKYYPQIESDYASLNSGLQLLENLTRTIEGIIEIAQAKIEIEQTKSDRELNTTVAIASLGIATSSVTATIVSTQLPTIDKAANFGISITPVAIAVLILGILRGYRR